MNNIISFCERIVDTWYVFRVTKNFWKRLFDMCAGVVIGIILGADLLFARSINMAEAGVTLWVFIVVGAFIILLQAIPAFILFTTFVATMHRRSKEKV